MTAAELKKALQGGQFPELLLIYGEESYFVDEAASQVCKAVVPEEYRDFNLNRFVGREFKAVDVIDQARTLPVFAPHRLVFIKDIHDTSADQLEQLLAYLEDPVPETVLLATAAKIDKRKKFFQLFVKKGAAVEFKKIYDNQLPSFVRDAAKSKGVTFTGDALKLFCKRVGTNLVEVQGELEKLITFIGQKDMVEEADVASVISDTRIESIFELMEAFGQGRQDKALLLLNRLLDDGHAPLMVLAMLTRHFRQLWRAKELVERQTPQKDLPRLVGISPYFLKGIVRQSENYSQRDFKKVFEMFLQTDLALKSSGAQPRTHLEKLVMDVSVMATRQSG